MSAAFRPEAARRETLTDDRRGLWEQPRGSTLVDVLAGPAATYPDLIALQLCNHGREPEAITWGELWQQARVRAAWLAAGGVRHGDRMLLPLPTSREFVETFFGALVAGAIPVPLSPPASLRGSRLAAYLEHLLSIADDCRPAAVVAMDRVAEKLKETLPTERPGLRVLSAEAPPPRTPIKPNWPVPSDTALLQYTSGSTSRPKGVELTHANVLANAAAIVHTFVDASTVCLSWLPLHHDMGLIGNCLTGLYCRSPLVFMPPQAFVKDPSSWLRGVSDYGATVTVAPNIAFEYCVEKVSLEELAGVRLHSLTVMLNGAEPVVPAAIRNFEQKFAPLGLRPGLVRPVYGLAESSVAVTFSDPGGCSIDTIDAERLEQEGRAVPTAPGRRARRIVSVGRPIITQEVRIVDASDKPLAERQVGEVVVRGPSVMKGYFNRPAETEKVLRNGWLHTGDLGYMAGGQLYLTGRAKHVIIRYGRNFHAEDIETRVTSVAGTIKGRAVAFDAKNKTRSHVVVVVESRLHSTADLSEIAKLIRERCHDTFLFAPDDVCIVRPGAIPTTTSGKVRRLECKAKYVAGQLARVNAPDSVEEFQ